MSDANPSSGSEAADSARGERRGKAERAASAELSEGDFESFGPREMEKLGLEGWEAAFDHDSWITGEELIDRVERDLQRRIAYRDVFAVLERLEEDEPHLLAYSDEGYAIVYPDGAVEGTGTVVRDVKPSVALCSMDDYEVEEPPEDWELPSPEEVPEGTGDLGNKMLQVLAFGLGLSGLGMILASVFSGGAIGTRLIPFVLGGIFLVGSLFLFITVANARLSDRFRAVEYRDRLRAAHVHSPERPEFVPVEGGKLVPMEAVSEPEEGE
ncbi:tripartite tricarboxylate transporter TctB family protein [Natronorarus salvus]|uniref:tripartite tricarboxylate transporter TctB family protein n=1 Tax=Natronorarus salvus TaxID=3117733 RepID=UPI002F2603D7